MGKGSKRRPTKVPEEKFQDRWDTVFQPDNPPRERESEDESEREEKPRRPSQN